eukprot:TRINITY_DN6408_c0_g1_i1.p1 TRINITY_DN6408_c0_g1~~TRINITY_DN6408_c0_g1_i1.p1  ORF type:complete len:533 (+),score=263.72 TRINITY_DN6408_c0_g1_i1:30-1628(+)
MKHNRKPTSVSNSKKPFKKAVGNTKKSFKAKHAKPVAAPDAQEMLLEDLVFDDLHTSTFLDSSVVENKLAKIKNEDDDDEDDDEDQDNEIKEEEVEIKQETDEEIKQEDDEDDADDEEDIDVKVESLVPAWDDEDDSNLNVKIGQNRLTKKLRSDLSENTISGDQLSEKLRSQFEKNFTAPSWAEIKETNEDEEEEILRDASSKLGFDQGRLPEGTIRITKLKSANLNNRTHTPLTSVKFHKDGELLLASSLDHHLRLFHIDRETNPTAHDVFLQDMSVYSSFFTRRGSEVVATGRRSFIYAFDLESESIQKINQIRGEPELSLENAMANDNHIVVFAKDGRMLFLSHQTKQCQFTLKMNGTASTGSFSHDGQYFYSSGAPGDIYKWDLRTRRCVQRYADDGAIRNSAIAMSPDGLYQATGTDCGVVNVYGMDQSGNVNTKPLKSLYNLRTSANNLTFNSSSQLLAISSSKMKDSCRLVHIPSWTVFSNWPKSDIKLGELTSFDFSPRSDLLACGNKEGILSLFELGHFSRS